MTSNEKSFPWDDHNGDREYSSDEFAEFFSTLFKPGVVATANFGTGLQITESASLGMRVKFGSGEAFSSFGRNYVHDKDEEVTVPIASTLQDRTDSVAIQFNKSQREAFFVYKESDVTVTRTDSIFELQIAKILVPKNSTQITNANITDMRANESVCGYFSPHGKLNAGDITAQFIAWFEDFKGKLGTDPAINLQLQINDLDSRAVHNTGDEDIAGKKNFTDDMKTKNLEVTGNLELPTADLTVTTKSGLILILTKRGDSAEVSFSGEVSNVTPGKMIPGTWVDNPFHPTTTKQLMGHFAGRDTSFHIDLKPDGSMIWWGAAIGTAPLTARGTSTYLLN